MPQFLRLDAPLPAQFATLIATFVSLATLNALGYALLADRLRARIRRPATLRWMNRAGGDRADRHGRADRQPRPPLSASAGKTPIRQRMTGGADGPRHFPCVARDPQAG